jgi:hypothetical protein
MMSTHREYCNYGQSHETIRFFSAGGSFGAVRGMSRRLVEVALFSVLIGVLLVTNINIHPAWAQVMTITPDPPIANQPFTISIPAPDTGPVYVENVSGCSGSAVFSAFVGAPSYSVTVPGQPAGQYSFFLGTTTDCVDFNIVPP